MGNPKKIASYEMSLVMALEQLADSPEIREREIRFQTASSCATWTSRFYSCRRLLAQREEQQGNTQRSQNFYRVGIKIVEREEQTGKPITIKITNQTGKMPPEAQAAIDDLLEEFAREDAPATADPLLHIEDEPISPFPRPAKKPRSPYDIDDPEGV